MMRNMVINVKQKFRDHIYTYLYVLGHVHDLLCPDFPEIIKQYLSSISTGIASWQKHRTLCRLCISQKPTVQSKITHYMDLLTFPIGLKFSI